MHSQVLRLGERKGVQALIKQKYPTATWMHCAAHSLNLVFKKQSSVLEVFDTFETLSKIINFFKYSAVKNAVVVEEITSMIGSGKQLVELCKTRYKSA